MAERAMNDELERRRFQKHLSQLREDVGAAAEQAANEHPLDTLLSMMLDHNWDEQDPMVKLVRQAMAVPYPMPRWEAVARGLIEL